MSKSKFGRLERLGRFSARRPYLVVGIWIAILIISVIAHSVYSGNYQNSINLSGTQANTGFRVLKANDKSASGYQALVIISGENIRTNKSAIDESYQALKHMKDVTSVSNPLAAGSHAISKDGTTAYFDIQISKLPASLGKSYFKPLESATSYMRNAGLQVNYGGSFDQITRPNPGSKSSEKLGFLIALIVLLASFGSVIGAVLPLITALFSIGIGVSILGIVAAVITFGTASPTLAIMIGLGVGIDYAVFLTTRFRQRIMNGVDPVTASGETVATSGYAVLVAATSVSVALFGLYASGLTFFGQLGFAAFFGVATAAFGAITLVPAGLGIAGKHIDKWRVRPAVAETGTTNDGWHRYAAVIAKRPWAFLLSGLVLIVFMALPFFSIRMGHVSDGADPSSFTDKRAYDAISKAFGPGANGTLSVVVNLKHYNGSVPALAQNLYSDLRSTKGIAQVSPPTTTPNHAVLVSTIVPSGGPQSQTTVTLFNTLVNSTLPMATSGTGTKGYVTGATAMYIQFDQTISSHLLVTILVVLLAAFILIMASFRSLVLAIKAAIMNLLSIGAAYGVLVAIFQWGWGRGFLGISENVPIESYVPLIIFAVVFGLSMDYEVFLLSRIRESWLKKNDHSEAVAFGLSSTGRVITAAALIMASVFFAFAGSNDIITKMFAVGFGASVLIDATIVRLLLVPAFMNIVGPKCWWMPKWLDRIIPKLDPEGTIPEEGTDQTNDLVGATSQPS